MLEYVFVKELIVILFTCQPRIILLLRGEESWFLRIEKTYLTTLLIENFAILLIANSLNLSLSVIAFL